MGRGIDAKSAQIRQKCRGGASIVRNKAWHYNIKGVT